VKAVVVALLMLAAPSWAADWELNHEGSQRGEVTTYVREVSNSPVKAFKGVVELKASATSILAVITAVDTFPEWIFQSQGAERLSMEEKERIHMRFNGIWPVADRDVVLANTLTQQADGEIHLHSENAEGPVRDHAVARRLGEGEIRNLRGPGRQCAGVAGESGVHQGAPSDAGRVERTAGEAAIRQCHAGGFAGTAGDGSAGVVSCKLQVSSCNAINVSRRF